MYIDDDYQPGDEFDWDYQDDSQRCEHGTFIGSSWGPDVLCGWCESGVTAAEVAEYHRAAQLRSDRDLVARGENLYHIATEMPYSARLATALVNILTGPEWQVQAAYDRLHA
jgi:hypothetical protein